MYVEEDLIFYDQPLRDQDQIFDFMADELERKKYVTSGFREAIKEREQKFPTGLKLDGMNIAIVHTEAEYAKTEKLVIIKLKNPATFHNIETLEPIDVSLVFGLILSDSEKHLEVLKKLGTLLQNQKIIKDIKNVKSQSELFTIMKHYFN
ncbi:PTS sugar transporter subunit IIA [Siminovitchia fortis]|nr:PTS sugar transporter subunit IIA [Siminovitchia fortis]WHY81006.1 PTS sugar transporter subunit IIA [Siminovitchia fortis]